MSQEQLEQKNGTRCNPEEKVALIALGANLTSPVGPPRDTLCAAIADLSGPEKPIRATSEFYATPCFPPGSGPDYVNAAVLMAWTGSPEALLDRLHQVEAKYARRRDERWGMRTLDLDLIAFGTAVMPDENVQSKWRDLPLDMQKTSAPDHLVLPHPRVQDRAFVLVPLMDIAADWRHPVTGLTIKDMHDSLPASERNAIEPL